MLCERNIDIVSEKSGTDVLLKILKNMSGGGGGGRAPQGGKRGS